MGLCRPFKPSVSNATHNSTTTRALPYELHSLVVHFTPVILYGVAGGDDIGSREGYVEGDLGCGWAGVEES